MLKTHGRYPYSPIVERPVFRWPGGAGLAVYIAINVEVFPFGEGLRTDLHPPKPEPDITNFAWKDYGNRVGIWSLLETLDHYQLPAAALLNTEIYTYCPQIASAFRARGDEFVGHGRTNGERQSDLGEEGEIALIKNSRKIIAENEGVEPEGWLGPWLSETPCTPDYLQEAGYTYVLDWGSDDQPFWLNTRNGRIIAVPYMRPTNDLPMLHIAKFTPSVYADILIDQFDEMLLQSKTRPLVFNFSFHPFLIGQAFRLRHMKRVFEHVANHAKDIWLTRPGDIARHFATLDSKPSAG